MNKWLIAATVLLGLLVVCLAVCALGQVIDGVIALEVGGPLTTTILILLSEGFQRQPFIDLALVFAVLSFTGSLAFVRLLERRL
jgi:multisubunit Na+/H+ antiporter MnhF subunit